MERVSEELRELAADIILREGDAQAQAATESFMTVPSIIAALDVFKVVLVLGNILLFLWFLYLKQERDFLWLLHAHTVKSAARDNQAEGSSSPNSDKHVEKKRAVRIALAIAHPDDEAMFFGPTLKALKDNEHVEIEFYVLCLCNGDYEGKGKARERELEKSCKFFQVSALEIVQDARLVDGMDQSWSETVIASYVKTFVETHKIDVVLTFDEGGVSSHPNHIATFCGVRKFLSTTPRNEEGNGISGWCLDTTGLLRKYIGVFDVPLSLLLAYPSSSRAVTMNSSPAVCYQSMKIHHSQFVWYRKLFVVFSRYAYVNTLRAYKPARSGGAS